MKLPLNKVELPGWDLVRIGQCRALILQDIHIPYHNPEAVNAAIGYGKDQDADLILLNGDIADFYAISQWEKDPRERNFGAELEATREFLAALRAEFPLARIIFKKGNHEERLDGYLIRKAPELFGITQFSMRNMLGLDALGIEVVEDKRPIAIGDLNVLHGHEYTFSIQNPVNPARGLFLRAGCYGMCGHFHQSSYHTEKNVQQQVVACWSNGCLCDLHPRYRPINKWMHGFAFVEVDGSGKFYVHHKVIRNGTIY